MKKPSPKKEAASTLSKPEDAAYWAKRPSDDTRLDWRNGAEGWIGEYVASRYHPHRELIIEGLRQLAPFAGVLEVGCSAGPNLMTIQEHYPETQLAGIDVNADSILVAEHHLPKALLKVGSYTSIPFGDDSFDIVIADATLMYAEPETMRLAMLEIDRVARKGVILVEWFSETEEIKDFHWARNYPKLFADYGFELVEEKPLTDHWPHPTWQKNGRAYTFRRRSETSATSS